VKKAGDLLGAFFDEGLIRSAQGYSAFFTAWKRIAGDHLAAHSRIVELEGTVLVIEADHPGWVQLIQMKRTVILETIRKQFPDLEVTAMSIKLGKDGPARELKRVRDSAPAPALPKAETEASEPDSDKVRDPYAKISDDSFKDILRRLENSIKNSSR